MSLENGNGGLSAADVAAVVGNQVYGNWGYPMAPGYGYGGGLGFGGDATWLIILFLFAAMGGWGGNGGFGGGNQFPWMLANNTDNLVTNGFNQSNTTSLLGDISNAITSGFANAEVSRCNNTTNLIQSLNAMQMAQQQCCCDNRAGIADLKYTIATENCADRAAVSEGIRDVITNATANTQAVLDKLCQLELDAKNDKISDLERQLTMANLAASQTAQTAQIAAGQVREVDALYQRLRDCPVPTMPVYGMQPIFTCQGNACGCGGYAGFNGNV